MKADALIGRLEAALLLTAALGFLHQSRMSAFRGLGASRQLAARTVRCAVALTPKVQTGAKKLQTGAARSRK